MSEHHFHEVAVEAVAEGMRPAWRLTERSSGRSAGWIFADDSFEVIVSFHQEIIRVHDWGQVVTVIDGLFPTVIWERG